MRLRTPRSLTVLLSGGESRRFHRQGQRFGRGSARIPRAAIRTTLPIVCAVCALVLASDGHAGDVSAKPPDHLRRIERQLVERAGKLLERYGTTFYALAAYVDAEKRVREVVPERWAPLEPKAIAAALREALTRIPRSRVLAAGLILDLPTEQEVRIHLEVVPGGCDRLTRAYDFDEDGRVTFHEASRSACDSRLFPES